VRAADHLRTTHTAPVLLVGHSFGGAVAIAAAARIPEVRAVATLGAPYSPDHVTSLIDGARETTTADGAVPVSLGGRPFTLSRAFLDDISAQSQHEPMARLGRPFLVLHSPDDAVVAIDNARRIVAAAGPRTSFVALDGADHLLTRSTDADRVAALITAWAAPYTPTPPTPPTVTAPAPAPAPEPGTVVVAETGVGRFTQRVRAGGLKWAADEPEFAVERARRPIPTSWCSRRWGVHRNDDAPLRRAQGLGPAPQRRDTHPRPAPRAGLRRLRHLVGAAGPDRARDRYRR